MSSPAISEWKILIFHLQNIIESWKQQLHNSDLAKDNLIKFILEPCGQDEVVSLFQKQMQQRQGEIDDLYSCVLNCMIALSERKELQTHVKDPDLIDEVHSEMAQWKCALQADTIGELQLEIRDLQLEIRELQSEIRELHLKIEDHKKIRDVMKNANDGLHAQNLDLLSQVGLLGKELHSVEAQKQSVVDELNALKAQMDAFKKSAADKFRYLQDLHAHTAAEVVNLQRLHAHAAAESTEWQKSYFALVYQYNVVARRRTTK